MMRKLIFFTVLGWLFFTLAGTGSVASTSASAESQCRQEATEYDISTELLDDYIDGCLASRGELIDGDTTDVDDIPPVEPDDLPTPQTGDTYVAQ
jgi:hypothetical protein